MNNTVIMLEVTIELSKDCEIHPYDINNGVCDEWAQMVGERIPDTVVMFTPEGFDGPGHAWVQIDGKHYDSQNLIGVGDWKRLNIFGYKMR